MYVFLGSMGLRQVRVAITCKRVGTVCSAVFGTYSKKANPKQLLHLFGLSGLVYMCGRAERLFPQSSTYVLLDRSAGPIYNGPLMCGYKFIAMPATYSES